MHSSNIEIWLPVAPAVVGIVLAVVAIFVLIWLWKLVVGTITGGG